MPALTIDNIDAIIKRLLRIRSNDPEIQKELRLIAKYIQERTNDGDYVPIEITESDSDSDEEDGEVEEVIIDRTDPNYLAIR
jgi:hypothetical protein